MLDQFWAWVKCGMFHWELKIDILLLIKCKWFLFKHKTSQVERKFELSVQIINKRLNARNLAENHAFIHVRDFTSLGRYVSLVSQTKSEKMIRQCLFTWLLSLVHVALISVKNCMKKNAWEIKTSNILYMHWTVTNKWTWQSYIKVFLLIEVQV